MMRKVVLAMMLALLMAIHLPAQENTAAEANPYLIQGKNMVRLSPITAMDVGVGFGLSYERVFGADQMFALVLPVSMILEPKAENDLSSTFNKVRFNTYVYFTPGLKIYPFGQAHKVTYAVGPSLLLGYGGGNQWQYRTDTTHAYLDDVKMTRLRLGILATNYVNIQVSRTINLGMEGALGIRYYDHTRYSGSDFYAGNGAFRNGIDITGQFSLSIGFRF